MDLLGFARLRLYTALDPHHTRTPHLPNLTALYRTVYTTLKIEY